MGNEEIAKKSNEEKAKYYKEQYENRSKKLTDKDLDEMENSPWCDSDEMYTAYNYRTQPYKDYTHYNNVDIDFKKEKERFNQIDLNKFKNDDGTYNIIRLQRALKGKNFVTDNLLNNANKAIKKIHHEGLAFGNDKNFIVFDYGNKEFDFDFGFKVTDNLDEWAIKTREGICKKSDDEIKEIFFGEEAEKKWSSSREYNLLKHNCQNYAQEKINQLKGN